MWKCKKCGSFEVVRNVRGNFRGYQENLDEEGYGEETIDTDSDVETVNFRCDNCGNSGYLEEIAKWLYGDEDEQ